MRITSPIKLLGIVLAAMLHVFIGLVAISAAPKHKEVVYDHVGMIVLRFEKHDHSFSSTVGGETFNWTCDSDDHRTDCQEGTGVDLRVRFDNGNEESLIPEMLILDGDPLAFDALRDMERHSPNYLKAGAEPDPALTWGGFWKGINLGTFRYRLAPERFSRSAFCVPYTETKKRKIVQRESCYRSTGGSPDPVPGACAKVNYNTPTCRELYPEKAAAEVKKQ
jgi:hypothetical protein